MRRDAPRLAVLALTGLGGLCAADAAAATLDPPQRYLVRGRVSASVSGPRCCGTTTFTGEFDAAYQIDATGTVELARLDARLDDNDVTVPGIAGVPVRVPLRCAAATLRNPATGALDVGGRMEFPAGALRLEALSFERRTAAGDCEAPNLAGELDSDGPIVLRQDPAADVFELAPVSFPITVAGTAGHTVTLSARGRFVNRPPIAAIGLSHPGHEQGGCPAYLRETSPQVHEWVAEANDDAGLVTRLVSSSWDRDGSHASSDIVSTQWYRGIVGGGLSPASEAESWGPVLFGWGPTHALELLVTDHAGGAGADACSFRVVDTRAPVVTPPPATRVECSQPGGASAATSPELAAFLASASASDAGDASPAALPPQHAGSDVGPGTFFPADGWPRAVVFRSRDRAGNVGEAQADLAVDDTLPPSLAVALAPSLMPPDGAFRGVDATLTAGDACGGAVTLKLVGVYSDAPALDATDIVGADVGTDDRSFKLRARQAAPGVPRKYYAKYQGLDARGNAVAAFGIVKVAE